MQTLLIKKIKIVWIIIFLFTTGSCQIIYETGLIMIPPQSIAEEIKLTSDWTEIVPPASLEPYGDQNWISVETDAFRELSPDSREDSSIILKDGKKVKVEAVLYDEKGQQYEISPAGDEGTGFHLYRTPIRQKDGTYKAFGFPREQKYIKLKIRSEIPIVCRKIEWISNVTY